MRKLSYAAAVAWATSEAIMNRSGQYVMLEVNNVDEARFVVASVFDVTELRPDRYAEFVAFARLEPEAISGGGYRAVMHG